MKKIILIFTSLILCSSIQAQPENSTTNDTALQSLQTQIKELKVEKDSLKAKIQNLQKTITVINTTLSDLQISTNNNSSAIANTASQLGIQISTTGDSANKRIDAVDSDLSKNSLYGIIGVLLTILVSGMLYWLLSKRQSSDKTDFIAQLSNTKASIEESLVKEFGKQTELMGSQLEIIKHQKSELPVNSNVEPDHSFALKVSSEINLIERNINLMDSKTKGLKQLQASVGKLKDNLSANGYEMPELLGKQFHQGMKVIVTSSIPDENLEKDSEIISKVLIPQVNYNNKMIQTAQVEVSIGA
jgi:prefoldin subunit 5